MIGIVGPDAAFAVNAPSFVLSALLIVRLRIPAHAGHLAGSARRGLAGYASDARAGLAFARRDRLVPRRLLVQGLASLATGATGATGALLFVAELLGLALIRDEDPRPEKFLASAR